MRTDGEATREVVVGGVGGEGTVGIDVDGGGLGSGRAWEAFY